jgi:hypothetical protein
MLRESQRQYDKFEQIAAEGKLAVCVLGNTQTEDFELFAVDDLPRFNECIEERQAELIGKGYSFLGVCGLVDGVPRSAFSEPLGRVMASQLSQAYLRLVLDSPQFVAVLGRGWVN